MKHLIFIAVLIFSTILFGCKSNPVQNSVQDKNNKLEVNHFTFNDIPMDTISEGMTRRWFYGEKGQMAIFYMEKGAHIPWHKHPNEQITFIQEGKVKIKTIIEGKEVFKIVSAGEVIVFPENVPHEFWALEKTVDLDVHVPVRQDWLSEDLPDYLKNSK
ncbi:cupin domain-containing protein [Galbibacter sp. BG1]|uniref:cupin domain-containing protein n=1 Tax=Galbibacter sp. BG1 TaxID=1170699 RepID=UPI0015B8F9D8|nr:cupin domain-containing protein [Galbibacter sp. BG1]QLE02468.1 cupin domain-containing protein [Galbibacter sp. BG1]